MRELKRVRGQARVGGGGGGVTHINVLNPSSIVLGLGICDLTTTRSFVRKHSPCERLTCFLSSSPYPVLFSSLL